MKPTTSLTQRSAMLLCALAILSFIQIPTLQAQDCTFIGTAGRWSNASNWDCGVIPDPSVHNIIVPFGDTLRIHVDGLHFTNGRTMTVSGKVNMKRNAITFGGSGANASSLTVTATGIMNRTAHLRIQDDAKMVVEEFGRLKWMDTLTVDNNGHVTIDADVFRVTESLYNRTDGTIAGNGKISFSGTGSNYLNEGTGGIFACFNETFGDCDLDGSNEDVVLPITLVSFNVKPNQDGALVEWSTAFEYNNEGFRIERSIDHINWEEVGRVEGQVNSEQLTNYSFVDREVPHGVSFYRLVQKDLNGATTYSFVETIIKERFDIESVVLSHHGNHTYSLEAESHVLRNFQIYCLQGISHTNRVDLKKHTDTNLSFSMETLPSGLYILRTNGNALKILKE